MAALSLSPPLLAAPLPFLFFFVSFFVFFRLRTLFPDGTLFPFFLRQGAIPCPPPFFPPSIRLPRPPDRRKRNNSFLSQSHLIK